MRDKALVQWAGRRAEMLEALNRRGRGSRARAYEDLTWESFRPRFDGRFLAVYWDKAAKRRRREWRSHWVWRQACGDIPAGMHLHHVNQDPADDRLGNLTLMTAAEHLSYHSQQPARLAQLAEARRIRKANSVLRRGGSVNLSPTLY